MSTRFFTLLLLSAFSLPAQAVKPGSPVQMSLELAAAPVPGEMVELVLTATSAVDSEQLRLEIEVPAGLPVKGATQITVKAVAGEPQTLRLQVQVPGTGYAPLHGMATLAVGNATFTARAQLMLGKNSPANQKSLPSSGVVQKRAGDSGAIIEFPIR